MLCEICGKRKVFFVVEIEGATLYACKVCSRGAKIIRKISEEKREREEKKVETVEEEEIVENYGELIKKARQRLNLSLEDLAKKINERLSYLKHVEKEEILPNDRLIKKLEKALGIKLKEKVVMVIEHKEKEKKSSPSLMDIAEIEGELEENRG